MKKYILDYMKEIESLIKNKKVSKKDIDLLLVKIKFFQHERLIHLIVTSLVAILLIISFLYTILMPTLGLILLTSMFILLVVPYIVHYYFLENNVQKLYIQYDELKKKTTD